MLQEYGQLSRLQDCLRGFETSKPELGHFRGIWPGRKSPPELRLGLYYGLGIQNSCLEGGKEVHSGMQENLSTYCS